MTFRVGQKVVCVDAEQASESVLSKGYLYKHNKLRAGEIYTISAVGVVHPADPRRIPCVCLFELDSPDGYWAHRFRPIVERKTDISIFKKMLKPQGVDA